MKGPKITLQYEYLKRQQDAHTEDVDAPEDWQSMTEQERHDWCLAAIDDGLADYIGTSYEWKGMEE